MRKIIIYGGCALLAGILLVLIGIFIIPNMPDDSRMIVRMACIFILIASAVSAARAIEQRKK